MAFKKITGNAIEFNTLLTCIGISAGSRGQNLVKDRLLERIFLLWPEMDPDRDDVPRIDNKSPEAKIQRALEIDTEEQGVLAETFLAAVKADTTKTATFSLFRRAARLIQVSKWWDKQTTEKLAPFAGEQDLPEPISDPVPSP